MNGIMCLHFLLEVAVPNPAVAWQSQRISVGPWTDRIRVATRFLDRDCRANFARGRANGRGRFSSTAWTEPSTTSAGQAGSRKYKHVALCSRAAPVSRGFAYKPPGGRPLSRTGPPSRRKCSKSSLPNRLFASVLATPVLKGRRTGHVSDTRVARALPRRCTPVNRTYSRLVPHVSLQGP